MIRRRVPYLSDLPILGNLFRYDKDDVIRSELLIFLTPHVIGSQEDLDRIKQAEAARMNWCLSDVHEIHGPTGVYEDSDTYWNGQGEVIYPDTNPHGLVPGEFQPQEVPLEDLQLSPPMEKIPAPSTEPESAPATNTGEADMHGRWNPTHGAMPAGYSVPAPPTIQGQPEAHTHRAVTQPPPRPTAPEPRYYR
jgi:hypothetical protein